MKYVFSMGFLDGVLFENVEGSKSMTPQEIYNKAIEILDKYLEVVRDE